MQTKIASHKKYILILLISLFIAAFFTATQPIDAKMAFVSSIMVILFALPSYFAVVKTQGRKRGLLLLGILGAYALLIESSALATGFPYGDFIYNGLLGTKLFDLTPWTVAFAYPPILLLTYWFARKRHNDNDRLKILFSTAFDAMIIDLVLDPAAVKLGFWQWKVPGFYYGVPLVNFLGWLLTGFIGALIIHKFWSKTKVPETVAYSGLAILWFWTCVNIWLIQIIPAIIGLSFFGLIAYHIGLKKGTITTR
ncbi:MAG: bisanhydrobacterioruberin hydratase [Patescibacteria group bacterium]|nr:bisanhydrobacterioruberin hydratase [Patescibacteria group bacterium]